MGKVIDMEAARRRLRPVNPPPISLRELPSPEAMAYYEAIRRRMLDNPEWRPINPHPPKP